MKKIKVFHAFGYCFSLLCSSTLWMSPAHANYYQNEGYQNACCQNECCEEECCWSTCQLLLIAGASAAIGGLTGGLIADGKRGHRGHDGIPGPTGLTGPIGPTGPTGPIGADGLGPFIADTGQSLTVSTTGLFPATLTGNFTVTPFVTGPDGVTYEGPSVVTPISGGTVNFPPIIVPNPVFGSYSVGFNTFNTSGTLSGIVLNGTVIAASRDLSQSVQLVPLAGVTILPGESQFSTSFTYDNANIP